MRWLTRGRQPFSLASSLLVSEAGDRSQCLQMHGAVRGME